MQNIARDELVRLRYGYVLEFPRNDQEFMYEAIPQVRAPDRRRDVNRRGQPSQGGRRRRHIPDINIVADVNIEEDFDHNADPNVDNNDFGGTNSMGDVTQLHLSQPVGELVPYEPGSSSQDPLHTPFNLSEPGSSSQDPLHTLFNLFGSGSSSEVPQHDGRPIRSPSHVMHNAPFSHEIHQWYNEGDPSGTQTSQVDNPTQNNTTINFQYQRRYPGPLPLPVRVDCVWKFVLEVENYPKLKGIPPSVSTFPPLKIVDCKRNGNEWRWNKENLTPESVEPNTVEKLVERSAVGVHSEVQEAAISVEPTESDTLADCVDNAAIFTTSEQICEVEQTNDMDEFKRTLEMDDRVHEDQTDLSPDGSEFSVSDQEGDSPSNLAVVSSPVTAALGGNDDEVEVIPRTPPVSTPATSCARIQWDEVPNFMPLFTTSLPSFGQFAFDKELIAYQLKANKAHKEFVAFQKEANRVCKEYVAMKKGRSEDLSSAMPAAGSPPKEFDFRAALMSPPKTRHGGNVRKNSKEIPSPLRVWTRIRDIIGFQKKTIAIRSTIKWIHRLHKGSRRQDHGVAIALACSIYHIWRFRNLVVHEAVGFNLEGLVKCIATDIFRVVFSLSF
nr:Ribonuclease H protein [Ipomoea batatas]